MDGQADEVEGVVRECDVDRVEGREQQEGAVVVAGELAEVFERSVSQEDARADEAGCCVEGGQEVGEVVLWARGSVLVGLDV